MFSELRIPKFEDGEYLSEAELYSLAELPFILFAIAQSSGRPVFRSPGGSATETWNTFRVVENRLIMSNLCVIGEDGLPYVLRGGKEFDLASVSIDNTILFASLYRAGASVAFGTDVFSTDAGSNGLVMRLHWGPASPDVDGASRNSVEVGRLGTDDFEPTPVAATPSDLPALHDRVSRLAMVVAELRQLLLDPRLAPELNRTLLLDRLERLQVTVEDPHATTDVVLREGRLSAAAAHGLYLRLAYFHERLDARFTGCDRLDGPQLEHRLASIAGVGRGVVAETIRGFEELATDRPITGHRQVVWCDRFTELLSADRNSQLIGGHSPARAQPSPDSAPRQPWVPKVVRVDETER